MSTCSLNTNEYQESFGIGRFTNLSSNVFSSITNSKEMMYLLLIFTVTSVSVFQLRKTTISFKTFFNFYLYLLFLYFIFYLFLRSFFIFLGLNVESTPLLKFANNKNNHIYLIAWNFINPTETQLKSL